MCDINMAHLRYYNPKYVGSYKVFRGGVNVSKSLVIAVGILGLLISVSVGCWKLFVYYLLSTSAEVCNLRFVTLQSRLFGKPIALCTGIDGYGYADDYERDWQGYLRVKINSYAFIRFENELRLRTSTDNMNWKLAEGIPTYDNLLDPPDWTLNVRNWYQVTCIKPSVGNEMSFYYSYESNDQILCLYKSRSYALKYEK